MSQEEKFRLLQVRPIQYLIYLVVRAIVMVVHMFPYRMARTIGRMAGRVLYIVDRKHVRIAAKNLYRTRGICPPDAVPAFILRVYRHFAQSLVEVVMMSRLLERHEFTKVVHLRTENFDRCLNEGRGAIVVVSHQGNWEMIGVACTMAGYPVHSLMRPIDNPWIDAYLRHFRTLTGQTMIPRDRALGEMIRVLQRKKFLIVQIDQDARDSGVYVNFFGRAASTHRAAATLSLKYNAPVVLANMYREGAINHCVISDPFYPDAYRDQPDPVKAITQAITDRLEEYIRQHPVQWFWMHDRWKTAERVARETPTALV
jgi:Kdo2-lipid IVA lauroyltransferase/acyltransferase